jgi:hypothetical protein
MAGGQAATPAPSGEKAARDGGIVEQFVARASALTDEQREAIAARRRALDEAEHVAALRSGAEALYGWAEVYADARRRLAAAHVPDALERDDLTDEERRHWSEVARLVQLSIDEMLVALAGSEVLHPNTLRDLSAPWGHRSDDPEPTPTGTPT